MSDLIQRLREWASEPACYEVPPPSLLHEAADTIARLTAERDAARARYQWLLNQAKEVRDGWTLGLFFDGAPSLETLDDAIDAAIGEGR
jgi:argininosuccinate synthase